MPDCFFEPLSIDSGEVFEGTFLGTSATAGPWASESMHAGPPSALLAHAATNVGGIPAGGLAARVCVDILRPVRVGGVQVWAKTIRPGRRVALVEAGLLVEGQPVMLARVWVIRRADLADVPETPTAPPPGAGGPLPEMPAGWGRGYLDAIAWESVAGSFAELGPATVWARPKIALIGGREISGVERVMLIADSGNGISAAADPRQWSFLNTELTVHLHRLPVSERVWMSAKTVLSSEGVGLASTVIGDEAGAIGTAAQTLFVDRRGDRA
ncbi:MAG: thioesterase family protein [Candidatus Nanopelagicales bacterium]|nr:thioesterase family protein [Candidatus Nanopelagicales bacterium]